MIKKYYKEIIFTKTPLKGFFRYDDIFQIYPADFDGMPRSNLQQHFPIILEYWTTDDERIEVEVEYEILKESFSDTATKFTKQDKILSLLTTFTNHIFFRYTDLTGSWGMPVFHDDPGDEADDWLTYWIMPDFHWPQMAGKFQISEFSKPIVPEVSFIEHFPYYLINPNFDYDNQREITFPKTIHLGLNSYFRASKDVQAVLDSAIYYSVSAMEMRTQMQTLSLLASFTSVETMVNLEYRDAEAEKCPVCGQLKYSVARKYREYLLKYIGDTPDNKKKFNAYYSLRSKIVHTGQRLKTENLYANLPKQETELEFITRIEILQIGKLAIIQWLLETQMLNNVDVS
ncbi:MAG: hypothetical protein ACHQIM_15500 [Sphingobacteriales bacterium]